MIAECVVDLVLDWYWNPEEVYEGDEPLRFVVPSERFTALEMRPSVGLAKCLRIDGREQGRGKVRVRLWREKRGHLVPIAEKREYRDRITLDGLFASVLVKSIDTPYCKGVRAYWTIVEILRAKCQTDGKAAFSLSLIRLDD